MPPHALLADHQGPPLYAALDLGTNNCRLLVAAPTQAGFRVLDSFSRIVRLGEGLATTGALAPDAMDRAVAALGVCADKLTRRPVRRLRAVATEACRRALNGPGFLARVRAETGLAFEVIGPREEAELAVESCAPLLAGRERRALLFDIGGGSTELAWLRIAPDGDITLIGYASVPLGVVTLAERWGPAAFTAEGFTAMTMEAMAALLPFDAVHCIGSEVAREDVRLVGTSGTVTTLAGVSLGLERYSRAMIDGQVLDAATADAALARVRAMGRVGLAEHPCIGPQRVDFVLPGCAVFAAIRRLWPTRAIVVADRGLREGILLRMMRADREDRRRRPRPARPYGHRDVPYPSGA
jgi:exopolyphosphatase/guanosine-5'-triphosphate,3'-diphosphate pyrophosphatase